MGIFNESCGLRSHTYAISFSVSSDFSCIFSSPSFSTSWEMRACATACCTLALASDLAATLSIVMGSSSFARCAVILDKAAGAKKGLWMTERGIERVRSSPRAYFIGKQG